MLRAEPRPTPASALTAISTVGGRSGRPPGGDDTTTPGCQSARPGRCCAGGRSPVAFDAPWRRRQCPVRSPGARRLSWSSSAANCAARAGSSVVSNSTPRAASASRPPALRRGARRNRPCRSRPRRSRSPLQRNDARPRRLRQFAQPVLHQDPVFFDQRDNVGNGTERDQVERGAAGRQGPCRPPAGAGGRRGPGRRRRQRRTDPGTGSRRPARWIEDAWAGNGVPDTDGGHRRSCRRRDRGAGEFAVADARRSRP